MAALATPIAPKAPPLVVSRGAFAQLFDQAGAWLLGHYLQIAVAAAIATLIVLAMIGVRGLGQKLCRRHGSLTHWPATIGRVMSHTRLWFMIAFAAKLVDGYADPPALVAQTINVVFTIAAAMQGALWVRELILGIVEYRAGDDGHGTLGSAIGIIRLLVTIVLYAIAIVLILDNLGVNVTGLVAGLGIGGIAIGLAAKGIFDDLFSALSIIFDKPFRRGDAIRWDNTSGTVEAIGLKTTRVRAVTGEEVVISNTNLLGKELHNMARLARRRIVLTLGLAYYTPPATCARIPEMMRAIIDAHDKCEMVRCGLTGFGASSLDFELQFDVRSENYDEVFDARHQLGVAILDAFNGAGIDFAFPTQVGVLADHSGRPVRHADAAPPAAPVHDPITPAPTLPAPSARLPRRADMADDQEIEAKFWKTLGGSPFVMLGLDGARDGHAQPMTAVFDDDHGPLWFFTTKDNGLVAALTASHRAIATYVGKGHDLFATIHGDLSVDTDRATLDRLWNPHVAAWYEGGKDDPKLALLRLDAEKAQIWLGGSSIGAMITRLLGRDPKSDYKDNVAEVTL